MGEVEGFDWDAANVGHILRHAVTPSEVEEVATRPHVTVPAVTIKGEQRWKLFGMTASNRYLVVVFTIRRKLFRTVNTSDNAGVGGLYYGRHHRWCPAFCFVVYFREREGRARSAERTEVHLRLTIRFTN